MRYENLPHEAQAVIAKVSLHLAQQRKLSLSAEGLCAYRTKDGCMCAIGALIPGSLYEHSIEDTDIEGIFCNSDFKDLTGYLFDLMPSLSRDQALIVFEAAQRYHDNTVGRFGPSYRQDLQDFGALETSALELVIRQHICSHITHSTFQEAA